MFILIRYRWWRSLVSGRLIALIPAKHSLVLVVGVKSGVSGLGLVLVVFFVRDLGPALVVLFVRDFGLALGEDGCGGGCPPTLFGATLLRSRSFMVRGWSCRTVWRS